LQIKKTIVHHLIVLFLYTLWAFILPPNLAWAVQAHGGVEGLVSHEIGHLLFILGMVSLIYHVYHLQMRGPGWSEFKIFLWLILLWNFLTFSGHWMRECITPEKFITNNGQIIAFDISNIADGYFYLTRMDHLILVPAFLFLLFALKKWRTFS